MKIGILQCDDVREHLQPQHGNYPMMFIKLFQSLELDLQFNIYNVQLGQFPASVTECQGYLLTGSKYSVYEKKEWIECLKEYVIFLYQKKYPVVGICFGHQLLAHALGGKTEKCAKGWGVGVSQQQLFTQKIWMDPSLQQQFSILVSHQDQVVVLPEQAEVLAGNEFCPYGMFHIQNCLLGCQGHPEFSKLYAQELMKIRQQCITSERVEQGMDSLKNSIDHQVIGKWILNFLRQAAQQSI